MGTGCSKSWLLNTTSNSWVRGVHIFRPRMPPARASWISPPSAHFPACRPEKAQLYHLQGAGLVPLHTLGIPPIPKDYGWAGTSAESELCSARKPNCSSENQGTEVSWGRHVNTFAEVSEVPRRGRNQKGRPRNLLVSFREPRSAPSPDCGLSLPPDRASV